MRHTLWLMPLLAGIILMAWCYAHPLDDTFGREFLATLFMVFAAFILLGQWIEKKIRSLNPW